MEYKNNMIHWVCVMDVDNCQEHYADRLQTILEVEQIAQGNTVHLHQERCRPFYLLQKQTVGTINDTKALCQIEDFLCDDQHRVSTQIQNLGRVRRYLLSNPPNSNIVQYYFRIALDGEDSDIVELQYLILLLQAIPDLQDRVAVRFLKKSGAWSSRDYFRVSHYLRLIQRQYPVFYAGFRAETPFQQLTKVDYGTQRSFLPLLEIDWVCFEELSRPWKLKENYSEQPFSKLYTAFKIEGQNASEFAESLFRIGLRMMLQDLDGTRFNTAAKKKHLVDFICGLIQSFRGITALDMVLLGALGGSRLLNRDQELSLTGASQFVGTVQELSAAIRQILENIVNHSEHAKGVFSLRLQSNREYIKNHYPGYNINTKKSCLELLIADGNTQDNIITNFLRSNKADTSLKNSADAIQLENFFGVYGDNETRRRWQAAHNKRPTTCFGLRTFAGTIHQMKGAVQVRSSPLFVDTEEKHYFKNEFGGKHLQQQMLDWREGIHIPGTQFSVMVNRAFEPSDGAAEMDGEVFDFDHTVYATTYKDLAYALCARRNIYNITFSDKLLSTLKYAGNSQEQKDAAADAWRDYFNLIRTNTTAKASSKLSNGQEDDSVNAVGFQVYDCDLQPLCQNTAQTPQKIEPFCKGFLASDFFTQETSGCIKHCILLRNATEFFGVALSAAVKAVGGQLDLRSTNVYLYHSSYDGKGLPYHAATLLELLQKRGYNPPSNADQFPKVFPYALFLPGINGTTEFEEEILHQARASISSRDDQGYKIEDTHMRLGNKVHLDAFYEMALFFENPNYAYYTAFLFAQDLLHNRNIANHKKILFYGYASYSRSITWAMIQILSEYFRLQHIDGPQMEFAIYQNDLRLESNKTQAQMYFSREDWRKNPSMRWAPDDTTLLMIVPISSSLTTFDKMLTELNTVMQNEVEADFAEIINYTAFWVRDDYQRKNNPKNESYLKWAEERGLNPCDPLTAERSPTEEEAAFWLEVDPNRKEIVNKGIHGNVWYLARVSSNWEDPLTCEKCFPKDVLLEYPLVETDPTSTVPTQQLYLEAWRNGSDTLPEQQAETENDGRMAGLKGHLLYGHISRGGRHYQYYIKTREYFQQEKDNVIEWLKKIRIANKLSSGKRIINVLVVPQQTNNVEFSQFVYEYCFHSEAECVIINTEKEFRSNLLAEYNGLFQRLRTEREKGTQIHFHFVDTSVRSGGSFNRAVSLLSSCVGIKSDSANTDFRFEKVFLLISRLSEFSKCTYVNNPKENFHAYLEVHISAMRTFGDSCVPCKLQQDALNFFENSATKSVSAYWERKVHLRGCIPFDSAEAMETADDNDENEGYRRMMCAHRMAHYIQPVHGKTVGEYFKAVREFFSEIQTAAKEPHINVSPVYCSITRESMKDYLSAGLKIIVRPFFSYDYTMRCAVMDLYLVLSEFFLSNVPKEQTPDDIHERLAGTAKEYLLKDGNLEWILSFVDDIRKALDEKGVNELEFVRSHILKGLADIRSNYLFRRNTLINFSTKLSSELSGIEVRDVYEHYMRSILRLTHSSSDEIKSLWIEHLLQHGEEYSAARSDRECHNDGIKLLCAQLPNQVSDEVRDSFKHFLEKLLIENNRPLYQRIRQLALQSSRSKIDGGNRMEEGGPKYYERNVERFLAYEYMEPDKKEDCLKKLCELSEFLDSQAKKEAPGTDCGKENSSIDQCYEKLREHLQNIVLLADRKTDGQVLLLGERKVAQTRLEHYLETPDYYRIAPTDHQLTAQDQLREVGNKIRDAKDLAEDGYGLLKNSDGETYNVILVLDNNYEALKNEFKFESGLQKISPVYVYLPCMLDRQRALMLIRKVLMFRRKLISLIERDFSNNAVAVMMQQQQLAQLLAQDKVGDHAASDFVESLQMLLMAESREDVEKVDWRFAVDANGRRQEVYESVRGKQWRPLLGDYTRDAREWFLLRAYINSRIGRMFRSMARSDSSLMEPEIISYYAREGKSGFMCPADNLKDVFFTPVEPGYIRKNYFRQLMETNCFYVDNQSDFGDDPNASIDDRLDNLSTLLESYKCINLEKNKKHYAYLSEYLAVILLDSFVSALKASDFWRKESWSAKTFCQLKKRRASQKCRVDMKRKPGGENYDYLVITNSVYPKHNKKITEETERMGMSLKATRGYIDGLWRFYYEDTDSEPPVVQVIPGETMFTMKLPILRP